MIEHFTLILNDNSHDSTATVTVSPRTGNSLKKDLRKIYIVYDCDNVLYVGEAHTSVLVRFQRGTAVFNRYKRLGMSRNGYKGYKWLNREENPNRELKVLVKVFEKKFDNNRDFVQAVEGELVFLIRQHFHKWPQFQNEIHFKNIDNAADVANAIFIELLTQQNEKTI